MERKWVHSASMMFITRLHISPILAFLEARGRIYCFMSLLRSSRLKRNPNRCLKQMYVCIQIMKHYKLDHIRPLILVLNWLVMQCGRQIRPHWFDAIFVDHWAKICPILVIFITVASHLFVHVMAQLFEVFVTKLITVNLIDVQWFKSFLCFQPLECDELLLSSFWLHYQLNSFEYWIVVGRKWLASAFGLGVLMPFYRLSISLWI